MLVATPDLWNLMAVRGEWEALPPLHPNRTACCELHAAHRQDGGEGDRTPDLVNAIHALSQLSYAPAIFCSPASGWQAQGGKLAVAPRRVKRK